MNTLKRLPVEDILPDIAKGLASRRNHVLVAPPGAGKTTRLPPYLIRHVCPQNQRLLVLQPRRIAARTAAIRIAEEQGWTLGKEVGYRMRFDTRTSASVRIEFLTEALLTRMLQEDPYLEGVCGIIFDEFHERSLQTDLGLALAKEAQGAFRPDLMIIVMSATLDPTPISQWLGAGVTYSEGRQHPIDVSYSASSQGLTLEMRCAQAVEKALEKSKGHILVFLPGVREIDSCSRFLGQREGLEILPLHSRLSPGDQDRALMPSVERKVILATNIAETSLTIAGITAVVDSGLAKRPIYDSAIGLERLESVRISKASADQRAGRAGRTGPGLCFRLWTADEHARLDTDDRPQISRLDLCRTVLEVRTWGAEPENFDWFERPSSTSLHRADKLLEMIGALHQGQCTTLGHQIAELPLHPRLARVILEGCQIGCPHDAIGLAVLASEPDILKRQDGRQQNCDLHARLEILRQPTGLNDKSVSIGALKHAKRVIKHLTISLRKKLQGGQFATPATERQIAQLLLTGFPDRVAQRRDGHAGRFLLASGSGARLLDPSMQRHEWLVAVGLRPSRRGAYSEHIIDSALALDAASLPTETQDVLLFSQSTLSVIARSRRVYMDLVVSESQCGAEQDPTAVASVLAHEVAKDPARALGIGKDGPVRELLHRLRWLNDKKPSLGLPTFIELDQSVAPSEFIFMLCYGRRSFSELRTLPLEKMLKGVLDHSQRVQLDALAPAFLSLPDGRDVPLRYEIGKAPLLSTRFESLFGVHNTPEVAGEPIRLSLLAPNNRPIQLTNDLQSFWSDGYLQVRKELRGRYPKHPWPEDPLTAKPGFGRRRKKPS